MTLLGPADPGAAPLPRRTSTLAALASRDFRLLWIGTVISYVGMWMQTFGQGYLVVQLASRDGVPHLASLYLGLVGLSRAIPGLAFSLVGGALADRTDRRRMLLLTQIASGAVTAVLAALTIAESISVGQILLLAAAHSMIHAFEAPARHSMVPTLVPRQDLSSAIGLSSAAFNGAQLVGPVLGGLLYIPFGIGGLFAINALAYVAVVVAAALMRAGPAHDAPTEPLLRSIGEGLSYIRRDPFLRWVVALTAAVAILARPYPQLLPAITEQILHVGALELSWLMAASGAGSLVGALAVASLGGIRGRGRILIGSACALGLLLVAFALQRTLVGAFPLLVLIGFTALLSMGIANTLLQLRTPDELRGRVMSVQVTLMLGTVPLGVMILGSLGSLVGVDVSVLIGGGLVAALAAFAGVRSAALRGGPIRRA